jgi:hypothetical protein
LLAAAVAVEQSITVTAAAAVALVVWCMKALHWQLQPHTRFPSALVELRESVAQARQMDPIPQ